MKENLLLKERLTIKSQYPKCNFFK